jgi:hypothetical protein
MPITKITSAKVTNNYFSVLRDKTILPFMKKFLTSIVAKIDETIDRVNSVGIANNNLVEIDAADVAEDDYAQFTADGLQGKTGAEVKSDLSLNNVSNNAQLPLTGGTMTGDITMTDVGITDVKEIVMADGEDGLSLDGGSTYITAFHDQDNMSSNQSNAVASQQSIKAYADTMLPLAGGTMSGDITLGAANAVRFGHNDEFVGGNGTDLTISSGNDINLMMITDMDVTVGRHINANIGGNLYIDVEGGQARLTDDSETDNVFTPAHDADIATKKYVDDNAGGTAYWIQVWNARAYTRNLDWFHPHHQYGVAYYNWTYDTNSTSLPSTLTDDKHPLIVVPKNCTLKEYNFTGSFTGAQTYEVALMKGTGVTFGSAGNWSLSQVGATQSQVVGTANVQHTLGQEGLSVSLSKGDTLVPVVRRSTTDTSALHFFELAFSIVCEVG